MSQVDKEGCYCLTALVEGWMWRPQGKEREVGVGLGNVRQSWHNHNNTFRIQNFDWNRIKEELAFFFFLFAVSLSMYKDCANTDQKLRKIMVLNKIKA